MTNQIDHIAIGADTLEHGVATLERQLGSTMPAGGKHDQMGTHNCLAQGGNGSFIELISIDPDAPDPGRTRWFTLDDAVTQVRLAERPRALCWVVNTPDLDAIIADSAVDLGEPLNLTRGNRSWRLTVPRDGSLLEAGLIPAFIEWPPGLHPSEEMQDVGVELQSVHLGHPDPGYLEELLAKLGIAHLATVYKNDTNALSFKLTAASGERVIID